jgi:hypothetical protein
MIRLVYDNPPTFIEVGKLKKRKIYLGYNAIYAGIHYSVRQRIVHELKEFLWCKEFSEVGLIEEPVRVSIIYHRNLKNWDLDNKCGLWAKCFLDLAKGQIFKDDNVRYVKELKYSYVEGDDKLVIEIDRI